MYIDIEKNSNLCLVCKFFLFKFVENCSKTYVF